MKLSNCLIALLALPALTLAPMAQAGLPAPMLEALAKAQIPPEAVGVIVMPADPRTRITLPPVGRRP